MSDSTVLFEPIWFSSDHQLNALVSAYQSASLLTKLTGCFRMKEDCASLHGLFFPWMRMPLGFVSQGKLSIRAREISYSSVDFRAFGWRTKGLKNDLSFSLTQSDVLAIEPYDFQSPVMGAFDMPFTRIRTSLQGPLDEFLLCVGGQFNLPRMHARSRELRESLKQWRND